MTRLSVLFTCGLILTACSGPAPIPPSPGEASGYFRVGVSGYDGAGTGSTTPTGIWIELGEEAYVAVFEIQHERGAVLLWPYSDASPRMLPAGRTNLPPRTLAEERIAGRRWAFVFGPPRVVTRGPAAPGMVLVVASSRPLAIDHYLENPRALALDLADDFIDQTNAAVRILELVVENPLGHNWAWSCSGSPFWCRGR